MINIFIAKLTKKDLQTQNGPASKWTIITDAKVYYDSWVNEWNQDWKEGMTIQVQESQIASRDYNGKTYLSIKPLPKRTSAATGNAVAATAIQELTIKVDAILKNTNEILQRLTGGVVDDVSVDEIPF